MSILYSATYPDRTRGLILMGSSARILEAPDYPGWTDEELTSSRRSSEAWGQGGLMNLFLPSFADDERARALWTRYQRMGGSPERPRADGGQRPDRRADVLPHSRFRRSSSTAPTSASLPVAHGRYLAEHIPGAQLSSSPATITCPGSATPTACSTRSRSSSPAAVTRSTRTGSSRPSCSPTSSTPRAARGGGRPALAGAAGRARRDLVREVERFRGRRVKTLGDGMLAVFDGPGARRPLRRGRRDAVGELGVEIRAGCTSASASCVATTSAAWPCTSAPASPGSQVPARSSSRGRCATSSPARASLRRPRRARAQGRPGALAALRGRRLTRAWRSVRRAACSAARRSPRPRSRRLPRARSSAGGARAGRAGGRPPAASRRPRGTRRRAMPLRPARRAPRLDAGGCRERAQAAAEVEADVRLRLLLPAEPARPAVRVEQQRQREHRRKEQRDAGGEAAARRVTGTAAPDPPVRRPSLPGTARPLQGAVHVTSARPSSGSPSRSAPCSPSPARPSRPSRRPSRGRPCRPCAGSGRRPSARARS